MPGHLEMGVSCFFPESHDERRRFLFVSRFSLSLSLTHSESRLCGYKALLMSQVDGLRPGAMKPRRLKQEQEKDSMLPDLTGGEDRKEGEQSRGQGMQ